jgi:hypothetical protein
MCAAPAAMDCRNVALETHLMTKPIALFRSYLGACLGRAIRGSLLSALNWASIVGVAVVGAVLKYWGFTITESHGWLDVVEWGLIYLAVAWAIFFLVRLIFVAPFQIFRETEIQRLQLQKQLDNREIRQRVLNLIWDLRKRGVQIRNEFPVNFSNWHRRVYEWRDEVLNAAGVLSTNLRQQLETLNETHGYPTDIQIVGELHGDEHKLDLGIISEILRRLEKYLERDL